MTSNGRKHACQKAEGQTCETAPVVESGFLRKTAGEVRKRPVVEEKPVEGLLKLKAR